jgi:hypothetical protein
MKAMQAETIEEYLARGGTITKCPGFGSGPDRREGTIGRFKKTNHHNNGSFSGVINTSSGQIGFSGAEIKGVKVGLRVAFYIGLSKGRPVAIGVRVAGEGGKDAGRDQVV